MIYYIRDEEGSLIGIKYNNNIYYYIKNLQEDIIGITDSNYNILCRYEYDSWGRIITIKDNNGNIIEDESHIGIVNPYRYRSYYYDKETKLYYLNSRYYNPEWGRFINADIYVNSEMGMLSQNMYLYTENNPINRIDVDGELWGPLAKVVAGAFIGGTVNAFVTFLTTDSKGWDKGKEVISSFIGGAFTGMALASPLGKSSVGVVASVFGGAFIESDFSEQNSVAETIVNTAINGTVSMISGKMADKVAPVNKKGRPANSIKTFIKSKFVTSTIKNNVAQSTFALGMKAVPEAAKKGASFVKNTYKAAKKKIKSVFKKLTSKKKK